MESKSSYAALVPLLLPLPSFHNIICALQGPRDAAVSRNKATKPSAVTVSPGKPGDSARDEDDKNINLNSPRSSAARYPDPHHGRRSHRRTHILLRTRVIRDLTSNEGERSAWRKGLRVEGTTHRIKVIVSGATRLRDERGNVSLGRELAGLYEKSQKWWLEGNEGEGMFRDEGVGEKDKKKGGVK